MVDQASIVIEQDLASAGAGEVVFFQSVESRLELAEPTGINFYIVVEEDNYILIDSCDCTVVGLRESEVSPEEMNHHSGVALADVVAGAIG
jgi:hypothetical protein